MGTTLTKLIVVRHFSTILIVSYDEIVILQICVFTVNVFNNCFSSFFGSWFELILLICNLKRFLFGTVKNSKCLLLTLPSFLI